MNLFCFISRTIRQAGLTPIRDMPPVSNASASFNPLLIISRLNAYFIDFIIYQFEWFSKAFFTFIWLLFPFLFFPPSQESSNIFFINFIIFISPGHTFVTITPYTILSCSKEQRAFVSSNPWKHKAFSYSYRTVKAVRSPLYIFSILPTIPEKPPVNRRFFNEWFGKAVLSILSILVRISLEIL